MAARSSASGTNGGAVPRRRRGALLLTVRLASGAGILVVGALIVVAAIAEKRARTRYDVPIHAITVPGDQASIDRGARLARARFCSDCHGEGLTGRIMADSPELGRLAAPNLTSRTAPRALTDLEWERAVRHGVRANGSALRLMPAHEFTELTDDDLGAIIAYARQLPGSSAQVPTTVAGPLLKALDVAGLFKLYPAAGIDHNRPHRARLVAERTPAYGKYMASTCTGCHGERLSGGKPPGAPPDWPAAANLTPSGIGHYSLADFTRLLRTGVRPDGSHVNDGMPWTFTRSLDDTEIAAIHAYLRTVPRRDYGQR
ncbi:MAG: c-type cytochrome [Gemmatimonadaceae bacterium]|nr:c-type cytochrome [Gemmatimonadaceae bacterium]